MLYLTIIIFLSLLWIMSRRQERELHRHAREVFQNSSKEDQQKILKELDNYIDGKTKV